MYQISYIVSLLGKYETGGIDTLYEEALERKRNLKKKLIRMQMFSLNINAFLGYCNSTCPIIINSSGQLPHALMTSLGLGFVVNKQGHSNELKIIFIRRLGVKDNKRTTSLSYFQDKTKNKEDDKVRKKSNI